MSSEAAVAGEEEITEHKMGMRHSEFAITFLSEGENLVDRGDVIQASEKRYKAAEEAIKGRARISLLGKEIRHYWDSAWTLHVEGFHEAKLDLEEVKERLEDVKRLVGGSKS